MYDLKQNTFWYSKQESYGKTPEANWCTYPYYNGEGAKLLYLSSWDFMSTEKYGNLKLMKS